MRKTGFTLIELLLYVSIIGVVIFTMSAFLSVSQRQGVRSNVISEVENQALAPMQIMSQIIRNATSITVPAQLQGGTSATITVPTAGLSPTVFSLSGGAIMIQEGALSATPLTSPKVVVSNLSFSNVSATTPGTLRIQYTVSYNNPDGMSEYTYMVTTTGSATLR